MKKGFTLIELMIVIAIIAIIAAIAIPGLLRSQMNANETSAVGTLRTMVASQAQFRGATVVDQDDDGTGEYGYLQELSGNPVVLVRTGLSAPSVIRPGEFITQVLGRVDAGGNGTKSGYHFYKYLPDAAGTGTIGEINGGNPSFAVPADAAGINAQESRFICYAWPSAYGSSGKRCFVVNQQGEVYQAKNDDGAGGGLYDGPIGGTIGAPPAADAALVDNPAGAGPAISGPFPDSSAGQTGTDLQPWAPAGN